MPTNKNVNGLETKPAATTSTSSTTTTTTRFVLLCCIYLVALTTANILFKLEINSLARWPFFTQALNPLTIGGGCFLPIFIIFWVKRNYSWTKQTRVLPQSFIVVIALLDNLDNLSEIFLNDALGKKAGGLTMLLSQTVVPCTFVLSILLFRSHFTWQQAGSALCVLAGVASTVLIDNRSQSVTKNASWYQIVYVVRAIPASLTALFQEHLFRKHRSLAKGINATAVGETGREREGGGREGGEIDGDGESYEEDGDNCFNRQEKVDTELNIAYIGTLKRVYGIPLSFLLAPFYFLVKNSTNPMNALQNEVGDGVSCVGQVLPPLRPPLPSSSVSSPLPPDVDCKNAWWLVISFSLLGFANLWLSLEVVKTAGAPVQMLLSAASLPATNLLFSCRSLMGTAAVPATGVGNLFGLCLVTVGVATFAWASHHADKEREERHEEEEEGEFRHAGLGSGVTSDASVHLQPLLGGDRHLQPINDEANDTS